MAMRAKRASKRSSQRAEATTDAKRPPVPRLGDPVNWKLLQPAVYALGESADSAADFGAFQSLVLGITEPLRQLESLTRLAERALGSDPFAASEFREQVRAMAATFFARDRDGLELDDVLRRCECCEPSAPAAGVPPHEARLLDEETLSALLLATARLHSQCDADVQARAVAAVMELVTGAGCAAGLVQAAQRGGPLGVGNFVELRASLGRFDWVGGTPMRTMMGGGPAGGLGLPMPGGDLPMPGGGLPPIDLGEWRPPKRGIDELLGWLKKRKKWDPEIWDHPYPFWRDPIQYIDPRDWEFYRCVLEVFRRIRARSEIRPPARPARVTWSDGIASITAGGPCAGASVILRGTGLLQPGAVLLVPFADGCRAVAVAPADWTDTTVTFTLPNGAISGPIGFGDGAYIAAYDAWADEQNRLAGEIERMWCLRKDLDWVPPFRECPPDIGVNRITAGGPVIDAFTVNGEFQLALESGTAATLYWAVRNATRIEIQRISAAGPTFGGAITIVNPSGTSYNLGAFIAWAPVLCTYRLRAVGPCGAATRDVVVAVSKRPNLRIENVEVTQSIQTTTQSVRLVAEKPTAVRVTVRHGLNGFAGDVVANVRGRIRARRVAGGTSPWFNAANNTQPMAASPGASISVLANPSRNNTNDTLNFLIPPFWCTQTCRYEVEVRVEGFGAVGFFTGFDQAVTLTTNGTFLFENRRTLELRYIRVRWNNIAPPTDQTCIDTLRGAVPLLPTPTANIVALGGVGVVNAGGANTNNARRALLDDFDDRHNCDWWESLTEWLGSDCPDDDGAIWVLIPGDFVGGEAHDIPSNVCFTPPDFSPAANPVDRGPYAAHELSHCLNQSHVNLCGAGGGDAASAWPNNARLQDVPFDVTRNTALTQVGTGVWDVMTYCGDPNNTWPLPLRWERLWNEIGS